MKPPIPAGIKTLKYYSNPLQLSNGCCGMVPGFQFQVSGFSGSKRESESQPGVDKSLDSNCDPDYSLKPATCNLQLETCIIPVFQ